MSVLIPVVFGVLAGYLVVTVVFGLIFFPKRPAKIGPFQIHGLLRSCWPDIKEKIGDMAGEDLFSGDDIKKMVVSTDISDEVVPLIDEKMDALFVKVIEQVPMAAMFMEGPLVDTLKGQARDHLVELIPDLQEKAAETLAEKFDPKALILEKLEAVDIVTVERLLQHELHPYQGKLRLFGMAVGGVVGLLQAAIQMF